MEGVIHLTADINYGVSLFLAADLHSLFSLHPLYNIAIIRNWAIQYGNISLSASQWTKVLSTTTRLGLTAHFTINRPLTKDEAFSRKLWSDYAEPTLTQGYCVYSALRDLEISLGPQTRQRIMDSQEVINLGSQLRVHTKPSIRLMQVLAELDEGWYTIKELQELGYIDLSMQNISHVMKKYEFMEKELSERDSTYPRILQWKLDRSGYRFRLPYSQFTIVPQVPDGKVITVDLPAIRFPSANLPRKGILKKIGLGIRVDKESEDTK